MDAVAFATWLSGLDAAAFATWFGGGCAACAVPPAARAPGVVTLIVDASMLVEDGSGQAECWADGEQALQLLGLWHGAHDNGLGAALAALVARHGRIEARVTWVHPDEWDGTAAAGIGVRGRAARPLGATEVAPVVDAMLRAIRQPPVSVRLAAVSFVVSDRELTSLSRSCG